ncbi:MAG TPA: hypothetical protein VG013_02645 [Gemmataceae bacterium]|nr:hypothetical protein [Gemmataceae bacterium]
MRTLRAIRVLELIGSAEAQQVLRLLAKGDAAARPTRAAREAVGRLSRQ